MRHNTTTFESVLVNIVDSQQFKTHKYIVLVWRVIWHRAVNKTTITHERSFRDQSAKDQRIFHKNVCIREHILAYLVTRANMLNKINSLLILNLTIACKFDQIKMFKTKPVAF